MVFSSLSWVIKRKRNTSKQLFCKSRRPFNASTNLAAENIMVEYKEDDEVSCSSREKNNTIFNSFIN